MNPAHVLVDTQAFARKGERTIWRAAFRLPGGLIKFSLRPFASRYEAEQYGVTVKYRWINLKRNLQ